MESAFAWLNQLIEAVFRFCPRIVIVRATHAGVKWVHGWKVKAMPPGLHWYWPLTTEVEVLVTARQTLASRPSPDHEGWQEGDGQDTGGLPDSRPRAGHRQGNWDVTRPSTT